MENINWFGHASFSFVDKSGNRIYYIDPFELTAPNLEKADLVFITHAHSDHFSPSDLDKILKEDTVIIAPTDILEKITRPEELKVSVEPNKKYNVKSFEFETMPAYNTHPDKLNFHPKENRWVGYIFEVNGMKIYHSGDTDFIPEMNSLKERHLDVAMIPIGGHYTMDEVEAAEAANAISAKITVPMHYRMLLGGKHPEVEQNFKKLVTNSEVFILEELK